MHTLKSTPPRDAQSRSTAPNARLRGSAGDVRRALGWRSLVHGRNAVRVVTPVLGRVSPGMSFRPLSPPFVPSSFPGSRPCVIYLPWYAESSRDGHRRVAGQIRRCHDAVSACRRVLSSHRRAPARASAGLRGTRWLPLVKRNRRETRFPGPLEAVLQLGGCHLHT